MSERLDKFLSNEKIGSRKEVGALIKRGAVSLNGAVVRDASQKIEPTEDTVLVNGKKVGYNKYIYIMMNKPSGVLSATRDGKGRTVLDLVPEDMKRDGIFPAGRLDKDTTGLLVITNDGDMAHRMLSPKKHVYKLYRARLDAEITDDDISRFSEGIVSGDNQFLPAELTIDENDRHIGLVKIREGKFHQIKRMFSACGKTVIELKRLSVGALELDKNLSEGQCRLMSEDEQMLIFL